MERHVERTDDEAEEDKDGALVLMRVFLRTEKCSRYERWKRWRRWRRWVVAVDNWPTTDQPGIVAKPRLVGEVVWCGRFLQ